MDKDFRLRDTVFYDFILAFASLALVLPNEVLDPKQVSREKETHPRDPSHHLSPSAVSGNYYRMGSLIANLGMQGLCSASLHPFVQLYQAISIISSK